MKRSILTLFFVLLTVPSILLGSTGSAAPQKSLLANLYCSTIGAWLDDADCSTEPSQGTEKIIVVERPVPEVPVISEVPTLPSPRGNPEIIERIINTVTESVVPFDVSNLVTRDLFERQLAGIYNSLENSSSGLSEQILSSNNSGGSDLSLSSTDDLTEGATNLYFSNARVGSYISGSSTIPHVAGSAYGELLFWNSSGWETIATSSLGITGGTGYSNSDTNAYIHASSTIPKTYSSNTFTASQVFTGGVTIGSLNGILYGTNGTVGTISTSTLGLGDGSYLGLSDTQNSFTANRILHTNGLGTAVADTAGFVFDGSNLGIGTTSPYARLSVNGEAVMSHFNATSTTATSTIAGNLVIGNGTALSQFTTNAGRYALQFPSATDASGQSAAIIWGNMAVSGTSYSGSIYNFIDHGGSVNETEMIFESIGDIAIIPNAGNSNTGGRIQLGLGSVNSSRVAVQYSGEPSVSDQLKNSGVLDFVYKAYDSGANSYHTVAMRGEAKVADGTGELAFYNPGLTWTAGAWTGTGNKQAAVTASGLWSYGMVIGSPSGYTSTTYTPPTAGLVVEGNTGIGTSSPSSKLTVVGSSVGSLVATDINTGHPENVGLRLKATSGYLVPTANDASLTTQPSLWLKADAITGLTDGQSVTSWSDSSGNNHTATATQPISRPPTYYSTAGSGSMPTVRFTNSPMQVMVPVSSSTPTYIFIVSEMPDTGRSYLFDGISSDTYRQRFFQEASKVVVQRGSSADNTSPSAVSASTAIFTVVFNGASSAFYRNGTLLDDGNVGSSGQYGYTLGAAYNDANWANVDISEFIVYNGTMTTDDIHKVETYLGDKYNITVANETLSYGSQTADLLQIVNASSSVMSTFTSDGWLGVGTSTPWKSFSVGGTAAFAGLTGSTGAGSVCLTASKELVYNSGSDACLPSLRDTKHDIVDLTLDASTIISSLKPVSFRYNEGDQRIRYGFIAEDTQTVDDRLVTHDADGNVSGIDDRSIISILVKAFKELSMRVAAIATWFTGDTLSVRGNICVDDVCISRENFKALIIQAGGDTVTDLADDISTTTDQTSTDDDANLSTTTPPTVNEPSDLLEDVSTSTPEMFDTDALEDGSGSTTTDELITDPSNEEVDPAQDDITPPETAPAADEPIPESPDESSPTHNDNDTPGTPPPADVTEIPSPEADPVL